MPAVVVVVVATGALACSTSSGTATLTTQGRPETTPTTPLQTPWATASLSPTPTAAAAPRVTATALPTVGTATAPAGHVVTASARPTLSPTPRPTRSGPVTLTEADSGETISLRVGDEVNVVLGGRGGQEWDQPTSQSAAVRRTSASGGYPTAQPARATFRAVADGTARLEATTDAPCLHTQPRCLIAQREWSVDVVVRR